jgi:hypothetical protein
MPVIEACLAGGLAPAPPPPVVVEIAIVDYTPEQATVAAAELSTALAALTPDPAPEGTPPAPPAPVVEVAATVGFAMDIATIAQGSQARTDFEEGFKTSMAGSIAGGAAVVADQIIVDAITASRRRLLDNRRVQSATIEVEFHIIAPATVATQAASLVAAVDTSSIVVAGATASQISAPVVTAPPDVHCVGAWDACGSSCNDKVFRITVVASGSGSACAAAHGDLAACSPGDGACPAPPAPAPAPATPPPATGSSAGVLTAVTAAYGAVAAAAMML